MNPEARIAVGLVEDQPLYRALLTEMIDREPGFQVLFSAASVGEAQRKMPGSAPDVVLLDIELPDGSGFDLGRALRRDRPGLGVVLLSAHDMMETLLALPDEERSGWSYLSKTSATSAEGLLHVLRVSHAGGSVLDPHLLDRRVPRRGSPLHALTPRQFTAAKLVAAGLANTAIAEQMGISSHSVDNLLNVVYSALGVRENPQINPRVATALAIVEHGAPRKAPW